MSKHTATESLFAKLNQHTDGDSVYSVTIRPLTFYKFQANASPTPC